MLISECSSYFIFANLDNMKIRIFLTTIISILFFLVLRNDVKAQENIQTTYPIRLLQLTNESTKTEIKNLVIESFIEGKSSEELRGFLLRTPTTINVKQKYEFINPSKQVEQLQVGFPLYDEKGYRFIYQNDLIVQVDDKVVTPTKIKILPKGVEADSEGSEKYEWLVFKFQSNPAQKEGEEKIMTVEVTYKTTAANINSNGFESIELISSDLAKWSNSTRNFFFALYFPKEISTRTFSATANAIGGNVRPSLYTLDNANKRILWSLTNFKSNDNFVINFLSERINTEFVESDKLLKSNPNSEIGLRKKALSYAELLSMFDRTKTDIKTLQIYTQAKEIFSELYSKNSLNKDLVNDYAYSMVMSLGEESDSQLIEKLTLDALNYFPGDVRALESRFLFLTNQYAGNTFSNYLVKDSDTGIDFLFFSKEWDRGKDIEKKFEWEGAENFDGNKVNALNQNKELLNPLKEVTEISNRLKTIYPNNKNYIYFYIVYNYFEDFLLQNLELNLEKKGADAYLTISKYKEESFDQIKDAITKYESLRLNSDPYLAQLLLNYFNKDRYQPLIDKDTKYITDKEIEDSQNIEQGKGGTEKSSSYLSWMTRDLLTIAGICLVGIILTVLLIRFKISPSSVYNMSLGKLFNKVKAQRDKEIDAEQKKLQRQYNSMESVTPNHPIVQQPAQQSIDNQQEDLQNPEAEQYTGPVIRDGIMD